jgi:DNA-binding MarR family transcriptional regulator
MKRKAGSKPAQLPSSAHVLAPENLPFQLHLLVQGMTRRMQTLLTPYDVTPLHWGILCCLWRQDGLRTTHLAEQLTQLGGTMTVALHAMERRGLIRRRPNPADGRSMEVFLTERGSALERELVPAAAKLIQEFFGDLPPAEYERFAEVVRLLRAKT